MAQNTSNNHTTPDDLAGPYTSVGNNLIGTGDGATITPTIAGDQIGTDANLIDPGLLPLADNGGPTFTHALKPTSNARNTGNNDIELAPPTDQRGISRPQEGIVDIGAMSSRQQWLGMPTSP